MILWDAATGAPLMELAGHGGAVFGVGFVPCGPAAPRVVSASADKTLRLWDVEPASGGGIGGGAAAAQPAFMGSALAACVGAGGGRIVRGGDDNIARVVDAASGAVVSELGGHEGAVWSVATAAGRVATGDGAGTVRVWGRGGVLAGTWRDTRGRALSTYANPYVT